jgi:hypothetical protein
MTFPAGSGMTKSAGKLRAYGELKGFWLQRGFFLRVEYPAADPSL